MLPCGVSSGEVSERIAARTLGRGRSNSHSTSPSAAQIIGEILLTVGAVLLLFVIYEAFWTNFAANRLQQEAAAELDDGWSQEPAHAGPEQLPAPLPVPALGQAFARVHLPTLGDDAVYVAVEGTRNEDLRTGPGRYMETQLPGEPGNFALAGHRNGSGAVFQHLDRLNSCDAVVVETETQWLTYRLAPVKADGPDRRDAAAQCLSPEQADRFTGGDYAHVLGRHITTPDAVEVIAPLPGDGDWGGVGATDGAPGATGATEPTGSPELERMLTLTTCHPQFSNAERLIVHAVLVDTTPKSAGLPDALKE